MTMFSTGFSPLAVLCAGLLFAGVASAQPVSGESMGKGSAQGLIPPAATAQSYNSPAAAGDETHPSITLTPDKSELIRLDQDASSIIVGNPAHLGVLMDNRRLLILIPRQPGATYMTVLDSKGRVIMQRHVLVAVPGADYVRIRRSCSATAQGCQPTSVYYCPGMCHEVGIITETDSGDIAPLPPSEPDYAGGDPAGDVNVPQAEAEPDADADTDAGNDNDDSGNSAGQTDSGE